MEQQWIRPFFFQFLEGCERVSCDNKQCKSCPEFEFSFANNNEMAQKAVFCSKHMKDGCKLCKALPMNLISEPLNNACKAFDEVVGQLARDEEVEMEKASASVKTALGNSLALRYILFSGEGKLGRNSMHLDGERYEEFVVAMQKHRKVFIPSREVFVEAVTKLLDEAEPNAYGHYRALFMVFCFSEFLEAWEDLHKLCAHILSLESTFFGLLQENDFVVKQLLGLVQTNLSLLMLDGATNGSDNVKEIESLVTKLSTISRLPSVYFYNEPLSASLDMPTEIKNFLSNKPSHLASHCVITLHFKDHVRKVESSMRQENMARSALIRGGPSLSANDLFLVLDINRDNIINDTIAALQNRDEGDLLKKLRVRFANEQGLDEGGVSREFFYLLCNSLFSPDYGMFTLVKDKYFWFNLCPIEPSPRVFQMLGTLVSLAIYNSIILPIRFPLLLYKKLLGRDVKLDDIAELDDDSVNGIRAMREMVSKGEDVSKLEITFSRTVERFGEHVELPFVEGGENMIVTNDNLEEYVSAFVKWFAYDSVEKLYGPFAKGYNKLWNREIFKLFEADELDILTSGEEVVDWDALKLNAKYDGYTKDSQAVRWFWELFDELTNEQKAKFLRFSTGTDRVPAAGTGSIKIIIQRTADTEKLPISHTCFNVFALPDYDDKEVLKERVLYAIDYSEGFGLI